MIAAALAVAVVWTVHLGVGYLCRYVLQLGRVGASIAVAGSYLSFGAAALWKLGTGWQGWAGASGMLLPFLVALVLCLR